MARYLAVLSMAAAGTSVSALTREEVQSIILNSGLSRGVQTQVKMVEKIIADLKSKHRKVTQGEKETLQLVDDTLSQTTLPNIQSGHDEDAKLLKETVGSISECDSDLESGAQFQAVTDAKAALDTAKSNHDGCRDTEASLKKAMDDAEKKMNAKAQEVAGGPETCDFPALEAVSEESDTTGDFLTSTKKWWTDKVAELTSLRNAFTNATDEHSKHQGDCNTMQATYEVKYCMWAQEVKTTTSNYDECRSRTSKLLDETWDTVSENSKHRKADFKAVTRVRCLLKVLTHEEADAAENKLQECLSEVVNVDHLSLEKPDVPARADSKVAALGDTSSDASVKCSGGEAAEGAGEKTAEGASEGGEAAEASTEAPTEAPTTTTKGGKGR